MFRTMNVRVVGIAVTHLKADLMCQFWFTKNGRMEIAKASIVNINEEHNKMSVIT